MQTIESISIPENISCISFLKKSNSIRGKGWSVRAAMEITNKLKANLCLFDADLIEFSPEWLESIIQALQADIDLVLSEYTSSYAEGLISRILLHPLFSTIYRISIPYPIPKEFAISYSLLDTYLRDNNIWLTDVGGYGINNWILSEAITRDAKICKVEVGPRKHKPSPGKAELKLRQVTKTAFEQVLKNADWWQQRRRVTQALPLFGLK